MLFVEDEVLIIKDKDLLHLKIEMSNPSLPTTFVEGFSDINKVRIMPYTLVGKTDLKFSKLSLGAGAFGGSHTYG